MPVGKSGTVTIYIDPAVKARIHAAVRQRGLSMKEWFLQAALDFCANVEQPSLPGFPSTPSLPEASPTVARPRKEGDKPLPGKNPVSSDPSLTLDGTVALPRRRRAKKLRKEIDRSPANRAV